MLSNKSRAGAKSAMGRCISRVEIESVYGVIAPHVRVTPVLRLDGRELSLSAFPLALKLEQMQFAGSFKTRGAFANLLLRQVPACGVVAASGGNHGAAVATRPCASGAPLASSCPACHRQPRWTAFGRTALSCASWAIATPMPSKPVKSGRRHQERFPCMPSTKSRPYSVRARSRSNCRGKVQTSIRFWFPWEEVDSSRVLLRGIEGACVSLASSLRQPRR